jgi:TolB-like protein/Flp pilus assembly protein TadD
LNRKPSFFSELQRRNVYKVGAMYAVAGWLIVQVVTQVFPIFDIGALVQRIIVLAIIAGFPVALVLSWIYELTPQGIVKTDGVTSDASITQHTGQQLNRAIIGVLLLAILMLLAKLLWPQALTPAANHDDKAGAIGNLKSIAVLPFENLSDDKSNAYFAVGIQDEILTRLAKVGALKVISRTSTQRYASSPDNLPDIAHQLGVANILEGSVQRAGDMVHINVQLIRAATDDHLWADTYDRKLDNIFGVEGEVAGAIAEQLKAKLSGAEQQALAQQMTSNPLAYDAYLRARALIADSYDTNTLRQYVATLEQVVQLDPNFAEAWADLSVMLGYLYLNGIDAQTITPARAKQAADTASRLQPDLAAARLAQGAYRYRVLRDFPGAQIELEAALAQAPHDVGVLKMLGWVERREGHFEAALQHLESAAQYDPHDPQLMASIGGETLFLIYRWDEARLWLDRGLAIDPHDANALSYKITSYQQQGRLEEAARVLAAYPSTGQDPQLAATRGYQYLLEHRFDAASAELAPALRQPAADFNGFAPAMLWTLGVAQLRAGHAQDSVATCQRLIAEIGADGGEHADDTLTPIMLAYAYAGSGQPAKALAQARRAVELFRSDYIHIGQAYEALATVQAWSGDIDGAMKTLQDDQQLPGRSSLAILRLDPQWDALRGDARFQKLIAGGA